MPKIRFTAEQKAKAVTRHLQDGVAISAICNELSIHPNLFYSWQKQLFSEAAYIFTSKAKSQENKQKREIAELKMRISEKDSVIAELLQEYTALKKIFWGR